MRKIIILAGALVLSGCAALNFVTGPLPPVYVVFFPQRDTALSPSGKLIVDKVAAEARMHAAQMIEITGPSTKVAPTYDPSLAEPRMHAVEQALIDDGIDVKRLVRATLTTNNLNVKADPTGAQRVEIRMIDKPA